MKKILLTLLIIFGAILAHAQTVTTTVSGTVTNSTTGMPIANQAVYIMTDSSNTTFNYYNVVHTNPNGHYVDTLTIPYPSQIPFYVITSNCNGAMETHTVVSTTLPMVADFNFQCSTVPCNASFTAYPDSVNPMTIWFGNTSTDVAPGSTYYWSFGDGTSSTSFDPHHSYTNYGQYQVCLHVLDNLGNTLCDFCDYITVDSSNTSGCQAYFQTTVTGGTVHFTNYSSGNNLTYHWNMGDGTASNLFDPTHTYTPGTYTICLTVSNSNGCSDTYCQTIVITNTGNGCSASFTAYPDSTNNLHYWFHNTSANVANGSTYYWDFGDGTTSVQTNPDHTYSNFGQYHVCLYIVDSINNILCDHCEYIIVDSSNTAGCQAYFGWNSTSSNSVYFFDYSASTGPSDLIASWSWSFGDGTSSTVQNPIHTFGTGVYNVCLSITTQSGCSSTYCNHVQVNYIDSSNFCNLYVTANTIVNESAHGASDGSIDIDVFGGIGPYTFSWSNGATTEDVSGLTAGYYDVIVTDNSGLQGCHTLASFEILNQADSTNWGYIDTLFTTPFDSCFSFSIGSAFIYSFNFINNTSIEITWIVYDTQGVNHGFVTTVYTFSTSGNYQFTVTINCGVYKSTHVFYDNLYIMSPTGINEVSSSQKSISLYPNPVNDLLNIAVGDIIGDVTVNISNAAGQIIQTISKTQLDGQLLSVNTSSLPKGLYFVQVVSDEQILSGRFIK